MAENFSSYAQEWLKLQQEYWNRTLGMNIDPKDQGGWADTVESWWQTFIPSLSSSNYETIKKFIEQSQHYLLFGEEFIKIYQGLSNSEVAEWQHFWESNFKENFLNLFIKQSGMAFGEVPLGNWPQALASLSSLSCDVLKLFDQNHLTREENTWFSWVNHSLHRWQEQMQKRVHLWTHYQSAQEAYMSLLMKMSMDAMELLSRQLLNPQEGKKIDHLRALYDLWIECSEEAYMNVVNGEEYGEVQARLINSLVALKHSEREWMDEFLCTLNIPTRKEVDTLNAYLQQMKRDIHRLRQQNELTINELRKEVEELQGQLEGCKKKTPTPRKKTAKKTTSE